MQVFWALEPHDLLHRSRVMATERAETFTLMVDPARKGDQKITIHGEEAHLRRATDLATLVERFSKWLPGMINVTFTKHDQPACALGYQHKERLLELASEGDCGPFRRIPTPQKLTDLGRLYIKRFYKA